MVGLAPGEAWGHRIRAVALSSLGQHAQAIEAAAATIRLAPNEWLSHRVYATAALPIPTRRQDAYSAAHRAVELAPHEPETHFVLALHPAESLQSPTTSRVVRVPPDARTGP